MIAISIKQVNMPIYENNDSILFHRDAPLKKLKASHIQLEINTVAGLHTYTVVGICDPEVFSKVKEVVFLPLWM